MRFRRAVAALSLVLYLTGCAGWHQLEVAQPTPAQDGKALRVTLKTGKRVELSEARIARDSLYGVVVGDSLTPNGWVANRRLGTAIALVDVVKLEDRRVSSGNTMGGILIGGLALLVGIGYGVVSSFSGWR